MSINYLPPPLSKKGWRRKVKIADKILKMENNKWMFTRQGIQTFFEVIVIKIV